MAYRNYGPCQGAIINPRPGNGDFVDFPTAMASAVNAFNTIYYVNEGGSSYFSQDFTMPAGVLITSMPGSGDNGNIQLSTNITINAAGNYTLSNFEYISTGSAQITISGTGIVNVVFDSMSFLSAGATTVVFSNTNASSTVTFQNCNFDTSTNAAVAFSATSPGTLNFNYCILNNTANSTVYNTHNAGFLRFYHCIVYQGVQTSGTNELNAQHNFFITNLFTPLIVGGNTANKNIVFHCEFYAQAFQAVTISALCTCGFDQCTVQSNFNPAIGGSGTILMGFITMIGSNNSIGAALTIQRLQSYVGSLSLIPTSTLEMETGTTLQIDSGATVQVQNGATLNINTGANIDVPLSGLLIGKGVNNPVTSLPLTSNGQLAIGGAGGPAAATLTAGNGITITNAANSITIAASGAIFAHYTATAVSYQVLITDEIIGVTSNAAARTITMPNSGMVAGQEWTIKDEAGTAQSANNITISGNGANIDGSATYVINTNYGSASLYWNGSNFFVE